MTDMMQAQIRKYTELRPVEFKVPELTWKFAVRSILRGENIMLSGPTGCGKTMFADMLKMATGRDMVTIPFGSTQDPRSTLIGNTHFNNEKGTYVSDSVFVQAIQRPNTIINLEEFTRAHPEAHNILMSVLDRRQRWLRIDEHPDTPVIHVADGVSFVATANIGVEYTGTRIMDRALMDRFTLINISPLSKDDEVLLLAERFPALDGHTINTIASIACYTRDQMGQVDRKISTLVSTRATTEMAELVSDGFSLKEALEVKVYPFYPDEGGTESERTHMRQFAQQFFVDPKETGSSTFESDADLNEGREHPFNDDDIANINTP